MEQKITPRHLRRPAYLYVRQSTLRQVAENRESTERQYALKDRARALGWRAEQVIVIDDDLGLSGTSAQERKGFQRLAADVSLGQVGLVMGLEVSRLARNNTDWHRLLELCALTDTLILDEDGLYDPGTFNDRLLLGLKGAMSEAEIHLLRARLRGGILNKARKGELRLPFPVGYLYDDAGRLVKDPDQRVREAVEHLFATYRRTRSAYGVARHFREKGLQFPSRRRCALPSEEIIWRPLTPQRVVEMLHNPRYAGTFVYGMTKSRKNPMNGKRRTERLAREEWAVFLPGAHEGYLAWEEYLKNQEQLTKNAATCRGDRRHGPPREGSALLQGIVVCGRCGDRMMIQYGGRGLAPMPKYICPRHGNESTRRFCQVVQGRAIDEAVGEVLLETVTPMAVEVAMEVFEEIRSRRVEVVRMHERRLEQTRQEAEMARRRFLRVNPENRLVAENLERSWNDVLRSVSALEGEYATIVKDGTAGLTAEQVASVQRVAADFPAVWKDPRTSPQDRKRMVRLLIEDVTLVKTDAIDVKIRFRGGATKELRIPIPRPVHRKRTPVAVIERVRELSRTKTAGEIAGLLNAEGVPSATGSRFTPNMVHRFRHDYGIPGPDHYLRERGCLTRGELAERFGVSRETIRKWKRRGFLRGHRYNDGGGTMYEDPGQMRPMRSAKNQRPNGKLEDGEAGVAQTTGVV